MFEDYDYSGMYLLGFTVGLDSILCWFFLVLGDTSCAHVIMDFESEAKTRCIEIFRNIKINIS